MSADFLGSALLAWGWAMQAWSALHLFQLSPPVPPQDLAIHPRHAKRMVRNNPWLLGLDLEGQVLPVLEFLREMLEMPTEQVRAGQGSAALGSAGRCWVGIKGSVKMAEKESGPQGASCVKQDCVLQILCWVGSHPIECQHYKARRNCMLSSRWEACLA
jgi:hypothetical protein